MITDDFANNVPGFDPDFARAIQNANKAVPVRDVPPLHPRDDPTTITDEEMEEIIAAKQSRSIFGNNKFRCQYGIFDINVLYFCSFSLNGFVIIRT